LLVITLKKLATNAEKEVVIYPFGQWTDSVAPEKLGTCICYVTINAS
jgi:hypothetical protein